MTGVSSPGWSGAGISAFGFRYSLDIGYFVIRRSLPMLRRILLLFYVGLLGCLFGIGMWPDGHWFPVILLAITVAALAVFILERAARTSAGRSGRPRRLFPLAAAAFMATVLVVGLTWALSETFRVENGGTDEVWLWVLVERAGFSGVWCCSYTPGNWTGYQTIFGLTRLVFVGSLAELLAAVPAHIFVTKRGGCFAGIATSVGGWPVCSSWSGPSVRPSGRCSCRRCADRSHRPPPAETAPPLAPFHFQYRLRTLLLLMLATGVICGFLRLLGPLAGRHVRRRGKPGTADAAATDAAATAGGRLVRGCAGLNWAFWGEWSPLTISLVPMGLYAVLLVKVFRPSTTPAGPPERRVAQPRRPKQPPRFRQSRLSVANFRPLPSLLGRAMILH